MKIKRNRNPLTLLVRMLHWAATVESNSAVSQNIERRVTIRQSAPDDSLGSASPGSLLSFAQVSPLWGPPWASCLILPAPHSHTAPPDPPYPALPFHFSIGFPCHFLAVYIIFFFITLLFYFHFVPLECKFSRISVSSFRNIFQVLRTVPGICRSSTNIC